MMGHGWGQVMLLFSPTWPGPALKIFTHHAIRLVRKIRKMYSSKVVGDVCEFDSFRKELLYAKNGNFDLKSPEQ